MYPAAYSASIRPEEGRGSLTLFSGWRSRSAYQQNNHQMCRIRFGILRLRLRISASGSLLACGRGSLTRVSSEGRPKKTIRQQAPTIDPAGGITGFCKGRLSHGMVSWTCWQQAVQTPALKRSERVLVPTELGRSTPACTGMKQ